MGSWTTESVAEELLRAERDRRDRAPFTDEWPELDIAAAYAAMSSS